MPKTELEPQWGSTITAAASVDPSQVPGEREVSRILGKRPDGAAEGMMGHVLDYKGVVRLDAAALQKLLRVKGFRWLEAEGGYVSVGL